MTESGLRFVGLTLCRSENDRHVLKIVSEDRAKISATVDDSQHIYAMSVRIVTVKYNGRPCGP